MFVSRSVKILFLLLSSTLFVSCLSGLDPLPSNIKDMSMSISVPVGKAEVALSNTYSVGVPNYWLAFDVPEWAKFEEIYFTDTLAVDLSKIYEQSSAINSMSFKINIWNECPAKANAQISFTDDGYSNIYKFDKIDVNKGIIIIKQSDAIVVNPGFSSVEIPFDKSQIEDLRTASFVIFHVTISLRKDDTNPNSFNFWNNLKLTCSLGARVDFVLNNL